MHAISPSCANSMDKSLDSSIVSITHTEILNSRVSFPWDSIYLIAEGGLLMEQFVTRTKVQRCLSWRLQPTNQLVGISAPNCQRGTLGYFATPLTVISPQLSSLYLVQVAATQMPAMKENFQISSLPHYKAFDEMETQQYMYRL